jgi:oxygen-dependent protoporphyrinogen oxidase
MNPIAVVGGGISGLTAAFRLQQLGLPVVVYEKQSRTGGMIQSGRENGFLTEGGPTSIQSTPLVTKLVGDLGIEAEKVPANSNAKKRYLVRGGRLVSVPDSPLSAITTPLFSLKAKLRILAEPFISRTPNPEPSMAEFVSRRLGKEVLEYAVDPLVGGIYAGRPEKLSIRYAFPALYDLEQKSGSLVRGAIAKAFSGKSAPKVSGPPFSFAGGLQALTNRLQAKLNGSVRTNSGVAGLEENDAGWIVSDEAGNREQYSGLIVTAPAPQVAGFQLSTKSDIDLHPLAKLRYSGVVRIMFGFERRQMKQPLEGFGFLVPRSEHFHLLGSVFCSSVYRGSAPQDHVSFLCFIGGARQPDLVDMDPDTLTARVLRELQQVTGVQGEPVFNSYLKIPQAIPQYELGHGEFCSLLDYAEQVTGTLLFAGNYRSGISVSDSLASGWNAAEKMAGIVHA